MAHDYVVQDPPRLAASRSNMARALPQFIDGLRPGSTVSLISPMWRGSNICARLLITPQMPSRSPPLLSPRSRHGGRLAAFKVRLHPSVFVLASRLSRASPSGRRIRRIRSCRSVRWGERLRSIARPFIEVETRRLVAWDRRFPCEPQEQDPRSLRRSPRASRRVVQPSVPQKRLATLIGANISRRNRRIVRLFQNSRWSSRGYARDAQARLDRSARAASVRPARGPTSDDRARSRPVHAPGSISRRANQRMWSGQPSG